MTTPNIQTTFRTYQQKGWPGQLVRPYSPHAYDNGIIRIPSGGTSPQPGYPVIWDATNNRFTLPASDTDQLLVCGILAYDSATVATENSASGIVYSDGAVVKVGVLGTFFGIAAEAMEYGDLVEWEWRSSTQSPPLGATSPFRWKKRSVPALSGSSPVLPAAGAAGGLPDSGDFGDTSTQNTVKAAIDGIISDLRDQAIDAFNKFYRNPVACVNPQPISAGELVELRIGYQVR